MSSYVKCVNCNLVISEVLSFIQNKVDVMDEDSIVRLCSSSFTSEEIEKAKSLLFESVSKKKTTRKRSGKTQRDLDDMISLIKESDPNDLPVFVAKDLQKLPPVTFDHVDVTRLLKDIIIIQNDLSTIQQKYLESTKYATVDQIEDLKSEINTLKESRKGNCDPYVNTKRGGYCLQESFDYNSGPMGLLPFQFSNRNSTNNDDKENIMETPETPTTVTQPKQLSCSRTSIESDMPIAPLRRQQPEPRASVQSTKLTTEGSAPTGHAITSADIIIDPTPAAASAAKNESVEGSSPTEPCKQKQLLTYATIVGNQVENRCLDDEGWKTVQKRRAAAKSRFVGTKGKAPVGSSSKFKAADVPLYIYNVAKEVSSADIAEYIMERTETLVSPEIVTMKDTKDYNSFKLFVPRHKLSVFCDDSLWPDGIFFRRYIMFKNYVNKTRQTDPVGSNNQNNR